VVSDLIQKALVTCPRQNEIDALREGGVEGGREGGREKSPYRQHQKRPAQQRRRPPNDLGKTKPGLHHRLLKRVLIPSQLRFHHHPLPIRHSPAPLPRVYSPAASVHLLEGEGGGGGGSEGERGGGEDEAGGRGGDVAPGVHGVEVLEAGEVEEETEEIGEGLVDHSEGGEEEGEQALGIGGEAGGELEDEEV